MESIKNNLSPAQGGGKTDKRERILEAALNLLFERGFAATRIIDIAQAAGIGKSTVYEYFPSKEVLYLELYQTYVAARYEALPGLLAEAGPSAEDKLRCFVKFDIDITRTFGSGTQTIQNLLPKPGQFQDPRLEEALFRLMVLRFTSVHDIIKSGMESGQFTQADPILATISTMGALSFFEALLGGLIPQEYAGLLPREPETWTAEELFHFICAGLLAR